MYQKCETENARAAAEQNQQKIRHEIIIQLLFRRNWRLMRKRVIKQTGRKDKRRKYHKFDNQSSFIQHLFGASGHLFSRRIFLCF